MVGGSHAAGRRRATSEFHLCKRQRARSQRLLALSLSRGRQLVHEPSLEAAPYFGRFSMRDDIVERMQKKSSMIFGGSAVVALLLTVLLSVLVTNRGGEFTVEDAISLARKSPACSEVGTIASDEVVISYDQESGTWRLPIERAASEIDSCSPACILHAATGETYLEEGCPEISLPTEEGAEEIVLEGEGEEGTLSFAAARDIALATEACTAAGRIANDAAVITYNAENGLWYFAIEQRGSSCTPQCVVNEPRGTATLDEGCSPEPEPDNSAEIMPDASTETTDSEEEPEA